MSIFTYAETLRIKVRVTFSKKSVWTDGFCCSKRAQTSPASSWFHAFDVLEVSEVLRSMQKALMLDIFRLKMAWNLVAAADLAGFPERNLKATKGQENFSNYCNCKKKVTEVSKRVYPMPSCARYFQNLIPLMHQNSTESWSKLVICAPMDF